VEPALVRVRRKLDTHLLDPDHGTGGPKSKWFEQALGFSRGNAERQAQQMVFDPVNVVETGVTQFGTEDNPVIPIERVNGKTIDVVCVDL
jgi:hypothetical protein